MPRRRFGRCTTAFRQMFGMPGLILRPLDLHGGSITTPRRAISIGFFSRCMSTGNERLTVQGEADRL